MDTRTAVALGLAALIAVGGCSDDGGESVGDQLRANPTVDGCKDAVRTFMGRVVVPPGYDPTDGIDAVERTIAESAVDVAAQGLFNPADDNHPCNEVLAGLPGPEAAEYLASLDPEAVAFLASLSETPFAPGG